MNQETIKDIAAEMRGPNSKVVRRMSQRLRYGEWRDDFRNTLKDYADRIEAAVKRDEAERKRKEDEEYYLALDMLEKMDAVQAMKAVCNIDDQFLRDALSSVDRDIGDYVTEGLDTIVVAIKGETVRKVKSAIARLKGCAK